MKRKLYPDEAVAFEDIRFGGGIIDSTGPEEFCGVAAIGGFTADGAHGIWMRDEVRPLTPAAEDVLAIVEAKP